MGKTKIEWTDERTMRTAAKRVGVENEVYRSQIENGNKWCTTGRHFADRSEFGSDLSRGDGLTSGCRSCKNARARAEYEFKERERGRRYVAARDGDRQQARRRVNYLVEIGMLPHPNTVPCADCGQLHPTSRHEYDHHMGYGADHHETVEAVCAPCHHRRESERDCHGY